MEVVLSLRVLHLDTELTWRGGENQLRLLLEGLRAKGVDCHVAVRPGSVAATRLAPLCKLITVPMRGGFDPLAAWRIARYCRLQQIQVIDTHTGNAHALGLLIKRFYPVVKLVVHRRVDFRPGGGWAHRRKYLSPLIDRYIAISSAIKDVLIEYGVPASRIAVVKSAVPTGGYAQFDKVKEKAALGHAYGIDPSLTFIGNASALTAQKGHETLIDAAKRLKDDGVPFHVFIAGDGDLTSPLEIQRAKLGLEHDVTFLGFIDKVPPFLAALDILAVPSRFEGLGTVLLDGLSAGLAVAASRVGGIPEVIRHQETGLLSAVDNDQELAANLRILINDPSLRARLNASGQTLVAREFSVEAMVDGNFKAYTELTR